MCRAERRRASVLALLAMLVAAACTGNPAPNGYFPPAAEVPADPYGAWIVVRPTGGPPLVGEFLGIAGDRVVVLTSVGTVQSLWSDSVASARIAFYESKWKEVAGLTGVGALTTLTNGFGLIFTMPAWLISGSAAASVISRYPIVDVAGWKALEEAQRYARFPAGVPPGLPATLPFKPRR